MLTRRQLFHAGLVTGCAACAALATNRLSLPAHGPVDPPKSTDPVTRYRISAPNVKRS